MIKAQLITMENKETKLTRTGKRPVVFNGVELADATTRDHNSTRWHKCEVHKTEQGKYVLGFASMTCWQGESDHYSVYVVDTLADVVTQLEESSPELAEIISSKLDIVGKDCVSLTLRIGYWMLTERGLFRLRWHRAVKNKTTHWQQWDRVL